MNKYTHSHCDVCECEVANIDLLNAPLTGHTVCRSAECRQVVRQKASMSEKMFDIHIKFNQKMIRDRRKRQEQKTDYLRVTEEREKREILTIKQRVFDKFNDLDSNRTIILTIPSSSPDIIKISKSRKREYIAHLKKVIRKATNPHEEQSIDDDEHVKAHANSSRLRLLFASTPGLQTISDKLCSMCKGGCCASGNNHAYLSSLTIRRLLRKHTELKPVDVFKLYISRINNESIESACINQGVSGCSLPRELRSDICNAFYCDSLEKYHNHSVDNHSVDTVVAVQRSSTYWNRFDPDVDNRIVDVAIVSESDHRSVFEYL